MSLNKIERRERIKMRIRKIVSGTSERPRMTVFRSNKQIYVQFIDDLAGVTLATASSLDIAAETAGKNKSEVAAMVGQLAAKRAIEKGIATVSFDRNGYLYHGRVKMLADAAREGGLKFQCDMANTNVKKVRTSDLELKDRLVSINRVTKVTKGGRTFSFSAIVVVGNENGVVGYGLGKASEVTSAIAKGVEDAKKNLVKVPVINGTIPHKQEMRFGGSLVMIRPAAPGTGIIAGGAMRAVLESVGVKNVLAKSKGSSNPHNLVKATVGALCELRDAYSVAKVRGISMNQVFNG